jgi:hypothetical protein
VIYSGQQSRLEKEGGVQRHKHPKTVQIKKSRPHSGKQLEVKASATPVSHVTQAAPATPSGPSTATPSTQATATPAVTVDATATMMPDNGNTVSNVPAVVATGSTPDTSATSTTQFTGSVRQKGAVRAFFSSVAKSGKKSSAKKDAHVPGKVECSRSTTHRDSSERARLSVRQDASLLLGSSVFGMLLYCFAFVLKRKK